MYDLTPAEFSVYLSAAAAVAAMKYEHITKCLLRLITMFGVKYISQRPLTRHLNTDVLCS